MRVNSEMHDKWKKRIEEWTTPPSPDVIKIDVKFTVPAEEILKLVDEFDSLKFRYESLAMRATYGVRNNY